MASTTSSSYRWVRSIGHSQSYHFKAFLHLHPHSPSFLDINPRPPVRFRLPPPFFSNHTYIDLHDTLTFLHSLPKLNLTPPHTQSITSSPTFLFYIYIYTYKNTWTALILSELHSSFDISDDRSRSFPFIKTFMTLDPFYAGSAVDVLYPYQTIMNSNHFSESEWSASHLVCLVR